MKEPKFQPVNKNSAHQRILRYLCLHKRGLSKAEIFRAYGLYDGGSVIYKIRRKYGADRVATKMVPNDPGVPYARYYIPDQYRDEMCRLVLRDRV